jgi:hypothetical protein
MPEPDNNNDDFFSQSLLTDEDEDRTPFVASQIGFESAHPSQCSGPLSGQQSLRGSQPRSLVFEGVGAAYPHPPEQGPTADDDIVIYSTFPSQGAVLERRPPRKRRGSPPEPRTEGSLDDDYLGLAASGEPSPKLFASPPQQPSAVLLLARAYGQPQEGTGRDEAAESTSGYVPFTVPVRETMRYEAAQQHLVSLSRAAYSRGDRKLARMKDFAATYWFSYLPYS